MDLQDLTAGVEQVSQGYARRFGFARDDDWYLLKLQEEIGELTQAYLIRKGQGRGKGLDAVEVEASFRAEVADVFSHVLLLAHHHGIDVVDEVRRKWLVWLESTPDGTAAEDSARQQH